MQMNPGNILVTGPPRCGKSTLMEKAVRQIQQPATGFFTREIVEKGRRTGFAIETLDGKKGLLAHITVRSRYRVGKYGVNLEEFEQIAVPAMLPSRSGELVVIDEIGKMECFSDLFKDALVQVLDSDHPVIASIAQKGDNFIRKTKARPDVELITLSERNRDSVLQLILGKLRPIAP